MRCVRSFAPNETTWAVVLFNVRECSGIDGVWGIYRLRKTERNSRSNILCESILNKFIFNVLTTSVPQERLCLLRLIRARAAWTPVHTPCARFLRLPNAWAFDGFAKRKLEIQRFTLWIERFTVQIGCFTTSQIYFLRFQFVYDFMKNKYVKINLGIFRVI